MEFTSKTFLDPNEKQKAKKIIEKLWKHEYGYVFHTPVDKTQAFRYEFYIKNPIDFGTIKKKLSSGRYEFLEQFLDDIQLVFDNCISYNPPINEYHKTAVIMQKYFYEQIRNTLPYLNVKF